MYRITREIGFSYGHRLHRYEGKCSRLHGHNGRLRVTLEAGDLDQAGMVLDFVDVKRVMLRWLDETLDHRMILHREDPAVAPLQQAGEDLYVVDFSPTAENLARHVFNHLRDLGLPVVEVFLLETDNCAASYSSRPGPAA
jgi:6-pyruvoyltetrahydropterin/6-carboxytetrahydropterin synthase